VNELLITLLEVVGLLLLAVGAILGLLPVVGGAAFAVGGVVVLAGAAFANRPEKNPKPEGR
jgi:hypothetical protein